MKKIIYTLMAAALAVVPALGRIGETREQCAARYGEPTNRTAGSTSHWIKAVGVTCRYDDAGKCSEIAYQISGGPRTRDGENVRFNKLQATRLLSSNTSSTWKKVKQASYGEVWDGTYRSEDGKMEANINSVDVTIQTVEDIQKELAELAPAEIENVVAALVTGATGQVNTDDNLTILVQRLLKERGTMTIGGYTQEAQKHLLQHQQSSAAVIARARESLTKGENPALAFMLEAYDLDLEIEKKETAATQAVGEAKSALMWEALSLKSRQLGVSMKAMQAR